MQTPIVAKQTSTKQDIFQSSSLSGICIFANSESEDKRVYFSLRKKLPCSCNLVCLALLFYHLFLNLSRALSANGFKAKEKPPTAVGGLNA